MNIRIKTREAGYCNLKLLLMLLVVYGHLIEKQTETCYILKEIYRWIYLVHMPLFAFLSGLFLKGARNSLSQMKRSFLYYCTLQFIIWLVMTATRWETVNPMKPYWHFWYLLSLTYWAGAAYLWNRTKMHFLWLNCRLVKVVLLLISIAAACLAGGITEINRILSFSRALVFFPYVLAGLFCPEQIRWERYRVVGAILLFFAVLVNWRWGNEIPISFLYQAAGYGRIGLGDGIRMRLLCYLLGSCLGIVLLTWIPQIRFPFSKAGANTMGIYICHALAVKLIWQMNLPAELLLYWGPVIAGGIVWFLFKMFQWNGHLFSIKEVVQDGSF